MILRGVLLKDRGFLSNIAIKILEPICGWQYKAFNEWFTGDGFKYPFIAEIDINGVSEPIGFLSLKHNPRKN